MTVEVNGADLHWITVGLERALIHYQAKDAEAGEKRGLGFAQWATEISTVLARLPSTDGGSEAIRKFIAAPSLTDWAFNHQPREEMLWGTAMVDQIQWMRSIAPGPKAIGLHRSKSVELPVAAWARGATVVALRDNFHDVEVAVYGLPALDLGYSDVLMPVSEGWVGENRRRCETYTKETLPPGDDWWSDWSGGSLIRHEGSIYVSSRTFQQGIEDIDGQVGAFEPGCERFAVSMDRDRANVLVRKVLGIQHRPEEDPCWVEVSGG